MTTQPHDSLQPPGTRGQQSKGSSFYADLCSWEVLRQAYMHVQENARELGIDPLVFETIEAEEARTFLNQLRYDLQARTYHPSQGVEGEGRIVLRDLVVQAALKRLMEAAFPPEFPSDPEAENTIKWLASNIDKGLSRAYVASLNESLDEGGQERLLERAGQRIGDPQLIGLLREILTASQLAQRLLAPLLVDLAFEEIDLILRQAKLLGREGNFLHVQCTRLGDELVVLADRDPRYDWILPAVQKRLREELSNLHYDAADVETQSLDLICGEPLQVLGFELRWVRKRSGEARTLYRMAKRANRRQNEKAPSSRRWQGRYHPLGFAQFGLDGVKHLLRWRFILNAFSKANSIQVRLRHLPITMYPVVALLAGWGSLAAWLCLALIFVCNWRSIPGMLRSGGVWAGRHILDMALSACALAAVICLIPELSDLWANRPQEVAAPPYMPAGFYKGRFHVGSWWNGEPTSSVTYGLYVPPHLQDQKGPFPLIVFLNDFEGSTEARLYRRNLLTALAKRFGSEDDSAHFNFVVYAPIDPSGRWLPNSTDVHNVLQTMDYVMRRHRIDPGRVYLTGVAGGGDGVWRLAEAYPDMWAALVPVHASYQPHVQKVRHLPVWIFETFQEGASVTQQKRLLTELQKTGADVRYTQTLSKPEAVWTVVYHSQAFYDWLAMKKKGQNKPAG